MPDKLLALKARFPHQAILVERFVEGREFNISLLAGPGGVQALPPAEMQFLDYPPGKERVLGYRAKWEPAAFEFLHTGRRFDFPPEESGLIEQMKRIAERCWTLLDLHGYARVDMRVDADSRMFVLEINANPCLTPDAGYAAALARSGIRYKDAIERIVRAASGDR